MTARHLWGALGAVALAVAPSAQAGTTYTPGAGEMGVALFEDLWPLHGDGDYNDVVVAYNVRQTDDGAGATTSLTVTLQVRALGASQCSGLALGLPTTVGLQSRLSVGSPGDATGAPWQEIAPSDISGASGATVFWLVDDLRAELCGGATGFVNTDPALGVVDCAPLALDLDFSADPGLPVDAPWDLFIHRCGDRSHQLHRPTYDGTPDADPGLYGSGHDDPTSHYTHRPGPFGGLPWVLLIGEEPGGHPQERRPIEQVWPTILTFAGNPATGSDYYKDGAVVSARVFTAGAGVPWVPPVAMPPAAAADHDGDGFCVGWDHDADPGTPDTCSGGSMLPGDCADHAGLVHPDAVEVCDGVDNDCDEGVDEPGAVGEQTYHLDDDGDGFGDPGSPTEACDRPDGFVADGTDCDDGDDAIRPGAVEIWYDGIDQDCGEDDDFDADGDGQPAWPERSTAAGGRDCDDGDASVLGCGTTSATALPTCLDILSAVPESGSTNYWVAPGTQSPFQVYCDMAAGGWTLIAQGGAVKCGASASSFTQKSHMRDTDTCGYLSDARVRALSTLATDVRLQVGTTNNNFGVWNTTVTSTNASAIAALRTGGNWHNGATFSGWSWTRTCAPGWASSWPNMYHACGNGGGVHWLHHPTYGYNQDYLGSGAGRVSATWVK